MYVVPNTATHAAVVTVEYSEGAPDSYPVAFGSFEECDEVARSLPAVANTSWRKATGASVTVRELAPFCAKCQQRHNGACA